MAHAHSSFFHSRQKLLVSLSTLYVLALILSHASFPPVHVWIIAAFFSVAMNFTYMAEARAAGRWFGLEVFIAVVLITASFLGVLVHPLFVIAAVAGHGVWDLSKHYGAGVPFFSWYTLSCAAVDLTYAAVLLAYWWQH